MDNDLASILDELSVCSKTYEAAVLKKQEAFKEEVAALNRLNAAQEALDTCFADLRQSAPSGSKWNSKYFKGIAE